MSRDTFQPAPTPPDDEPTVLMVDTRPGFEGQQLRVPASVVERGVSEFGLRVATEDEAIEVERERILGGAAGQVATAATAAQDELSLGAASRAAREASPEAAAILTEMRARNPGAQTTGAVGGALALGAATAGLGGAVGLGRAGTTAARAIRGVAEGVAAGGAGGAATLEQQLTADPNAQLTAERVLGTVGLGALVGGALGGATDVLLSGGGELGRRLLRSRSTAAQTRDGVARTLERQLGREPAPGVVDAVLDRIGRTGSTGLDDEGRAFVQRALSRTEEGAGLRQAIAQGDAIVDDTTLALSRQLDDLDQLTRATEDFSRGELKRSQVRRLVRDDTLDLIAEEGAGQLAALRRLAAQVGDDASLAGGRTLSKKMNGALDEMESRFAAGLQAGGRDGAADALIALDQLKRKMGAYTESAIRSRDLGGVSRDFEDAYEGLRRFLEREDLFGGAGASQREINAAWSPLIARRRTFDRTFRTDAGEQDGFRSLRQADTAKLNGWLQQTGTARSRTSDDLFERFVAEQDAFLQAVGKHYELPSDLVANVGKARAVTGELRDTLGRVRGSVQARNQFRDVAQTLGERDGLLGGILSPITGGVIGGAPGAAVGAALSALRRPDQVIRMMASLERMGVAFESRQSGAVTKLVDSMIRGAKRGTSGTRRVSQDTVAAMSGGEVADRFDRAIETLDGLRDPQALVDRLSTATQRLGDRAPEHATHVVATASRAVTHLSSRVPPLAFAPSVSVGGPRLTAAQRVPEYQQRAFLEAAQVVDDPLRVLDSAERGTLSFEQVDALRAVYPALHAQLVQQVVEEVADRDAEIPYQARVTLSVLTGAQTDPTLSPDYVRRSQLQYAGAPEPSTYSPEPVVTPGNAKPPRIADQTLTRQQQLTQRSS